MLKRKISELLDQSQQPIKHGEITLHGNRSTISRNQSYGNRSAMYNPTGDVSSRSLKRGGGIGYYDQGETTSGYHGFSQGRGSPSNILLESSIQEVEENFEASGYDFQHPNQSVVHSGRAGYGGPIPDREDNQAHHGRHHTVSLDEYDHPVMRTPQKLPAIGKHGNRSIGLDYMSLDTLKVTNSQQRPSHYRGSSDPAIVQKHLVSQSQPNVK